MPDSDNSMAEELRLKRLAGIERKKQEDAAWKLREEKPGYKLITRGPRKRQLVPLNYRERCAQQRSQTLARIASSKEASRRSDTPKRTGTQAAPNLAKAKEHHGLQTLAAFSLVTSLSLASLFVAKVFAAYRLLGMAIVIDVIAYWILRGRGAVDITYPFYGGSESL